jgi:tetratricopeptide (TPR) repeat protein
MADVPDQQASGVAGPDPAVSPADPPVAPSGGRRRGIVLVALAAVALAAGGGWYAWRWYTAPEPPELSLKGVEPAVARAVEEAAEGVRRAPRSGGAWGRLGQVLLAHSFDEEAGVCFARAQEFDPANPRWPYLQGLRLLRNDPEAALPYLRRAADLCDRYDEDNPAPRLRLAEVLLQLNRLAGAQEQFRAVLEKEPQSARAHYGLGLLALARNDPPTVVAELRPLASNPRARKKACSFLATAYRRLHDEQAADRFDRAARGLPEDGVWPDPYLAEYRKLEVGRPSRFRQAIEGAGETLHSLTHDYPDGQAYALLGVRQVEAGAYAEAEQSVRKALRLSPRNVAANGYLAIALFAQAERLWHDSPGKREAARAMFREGAERAARATAVKSDFALAHLFRGRCLMYLGRQAEAIRCFRRAVECQPELADAHLYLGEALAEDGRVKEARVHLRHAVQTAPENDPRPRQALERLDRGKKKEE